MSELIRFLEEEGKRAKVEALKATSYEAICDILDDQERQLEEARESEILFLRTLSLDLLPSCSRHKSAEDRINKLEQQIKEQG